MNDSLTPLVFRLDFHLGHRQAGPVQWRMFSKRMLSQAINERLCIFPTRYYVRQVHGFHPLRCCIDVIAIQAHLLLDGCSIGIECH